MGYPRQPRPATSRSTRTSGPPNNEDGNSQLRHHSASMPSRDVRPFAAALQDHESGHTLEPASHYTIYPQSPHTRLNTSVCSCFGDSVCPFPLSTRTCRCRRPFDTLGDHRSACAQLGLLRSRGGPLERTAVHRWSAMLTHAAFTAYATSVQALDSAPPTHTHTQLSKVNPLPGRTRPPHRTAPTQPPRRPLNHTVDCANLGSGQHQTSDQ